MKQRVFSCALSITLVLLAAGVAAAQQGTTEIRGRVLDAQGAVLPVQRFGGDPPLGDFMGDAEHAEQAAIAAIHRRLGDFEELMLAVREGQPFLEGMGPAAGRGL